MNFDMTEKKRLLKDGLRRCQNCKAIKELCPELFARNRHRTGGFSYQCKDCSIRASREWRKNNPEAYEKSKEYWRKRERKIRAEVLKHYGGKCTCCGENTYEFLAIDHIYNDGNKHRKELGGWGGGSTIYRWIIKNNYPKFLQILCHNCNLAKSFYGKCPHQNKMV